MSHDAGPSTDVVVHGYADVVLESRAALGEGVVWDERAGLVRWVEITAGELHHFDPITGADTSTWIGRSISAIGLREHGGVVLASAAGFIMLDADGTEETTIAADLTTGLRMNDAKPGPDGAFWAGTMAYDKTQGAASLLRLRTDRTITTAVDDLTIPNGLDWSMDHTQMYFVDTPTGWVDVFDYHADNDRISNRRHVADVANDTTAGVAAGQGSPDGMTLDEHDAIWVAANGAGQVRRYLPHGRLDIVIDVDAPLVTCCCFGGDDLRTLFISTARDGLTEHELAAHPHSGSIFAVHSDVAGRAPFRFAA